jgi:hypothetical protein
MGSAFDPSDMSINETVDKNDGNILSFILTMLADLIPMIRHRVFCTLISAQL